MAALSLPGFIVEVFRLNPGLRLHSGLIESSINWSFVIFSAIIGSMGVYIFMASDKKLKEAEKNSEASDKKKEQWMDWKAMLIAATIFILFAIAVVFKDLF